LQVMMAAKCAVATEVTGIEGRRHLVKSSVLNAEKANYSDSTKWINDDIVLGMQKMMPGAFDAIFMFGVFYHI
jgi:predicted O-methyltransferase YrrM